uniref:Uncharacterized protein n=1 Tax=Anguilla anguilla TaxID=7936 RepID=A0A0E9SPA8_ANGAN
MGCLKKRKRQGTGIKNVHIELFHSPVPLNFLATTPDPV